jgi:putative component of membrane protein insertase Oxa1/YidC/SpoIIIJ protein YidD
MMVDAQRLRSNPWAGSRSERTRLRVARARRVCAVWTSLMSVLIQLGCSSHQRNIPDTQVALDAKARSECGFEPWSVGVIHPALPGESVNSGRPAGTASDVPETHYTSSYDASAFLAAVYLSFRLYKETWSRADGNTCRFSPSCSRFGWQAIRRHGVWGALLTMARLTRSHGESPLHPVDSDGVYVLDPLSNYDFWYADPSGRFDSDLTEAQLWYRHVEW